MTGNTVLGLMLLLLVKESIYAGSLLRAIIATVSKIAYVILDSVTYTIYKAGGGAIGMTPLTDTLFKTTNYLAIELIAPTFLLVIGGALAFRKDAKARTARNIAFVLAAVLIVGLAAANPFPSRQNF